VRELQVGIVIGRGAGQEMLFDAHDLAPVGDYNNCMRDAIDTSDAVVFLAHHSLQLRQVNPGSGRTDGCRRSWAVFGR
jgi:hypothetical protein